MSSVSASLASLALLVAASCTTESPPPEGDAVTSFVETVEIPMWFNTQVDVLFVIDDSPAMAANAGSLATQYRRMMDAIATSTLGEAPDVHIGVVTTDLADQGNLHGARFLADAPRFAWQRERNYDGTLGDAFAPLAAVGTSGSADVQPLEAMQRALAGNPGFVRPNAYLAVVILAASDDHGTREASAIARELKLLKPDPSNVIVSAALPTCDGGTAPRLAAFLDQFPNRNTRAAICDADLTPLVSSVGNLLRTTLGQPCLENAPRVPHECAAWLADPLSDGQYVLPECATGDASRCWTVRPSDPACPLGTGLYLRPFVVPFPATFHLECVVEHAP